VTASSRRRHLLKSLLRRLWTLMVSFEVNVTRESPQLR
jgi:hypothetical protein